MTGFNIYCAGGHAPSVNLGLRKIGVNRLFTQVEERAHIEHFIDYRKVAKTTNKLFLDSGAWTAHTKGIEIDVIDYVEFVKPIWDEFEVVAQLDKIPGTFRQAKTLKQLKESPKLSWDNYLHMRELLEGYNLDILVPIFHQGDDFKWLVNMLETRFEGDLIPYIGISPANDQPTKSKIKWIEQCFRIIGESSNPNVKTHSFGMTVTDVLEQYPFHSADSTSWVLTAAMGEIMTSKGVISVSQSKDKAHHIDNIPEYNLHELEDELRMNGQYLDELRDNYYARAFYNAQFMKDWADNYKFKGNRNYQRRLF